MSSATAMMPVGYSLAVSDSTPPIDTADTAPADGPEPAAEPDRPAAPDQRTPNARRIHDVVKRALFSTEPPKVRVVPGHVFAGRYRIEQLLGRGGMGDVYRALDLVLDEEVALKLLPPSLIDRPGYYQRFLQEVRLARQVSHPSVCRVHDIGEVEGQPFISMEYVDGEDLAALLRRIGRLDPDKALELTHQLCAGLDALHSRGMIHRDLKPSNIMLDGEGRIRIADFGLASIAAELPEHEIRDGTPAYQAPEQRAGLEATARSDIYALGLVLREMFVGNTSKNSSVDSVDPAIADAISRCLEADPRDRPSSVLEVSAALPGGDPLMVAIAAGRLPSPQAIADTRAVGGLPRPVVQLVLAATLMALVALAALNAFRSVLGRSDSLVDPDVLSHRATELLPSSADDERYGTLVSLDYDRDRLNRTRLAGSNRLEIIEDPAASMYRFHLRVFGVTPTVLTPDLELLPPHQPHDAELVLDGRGNLLELHRVLDPERTDAVDDAPPSEAVLAPLLEASGVELDTLVEMPPRLVPPVHADEVKAWTASSGALELEIHAGTQQGQPVWFSRRESDAGDDRPFPSTGWRFAAIAVVLLLLCVVVVLGIRVAISTLLRREGDLVGARRVAMFVFVGHASAWVFGLQYPHAAAVALHVIQFAGLSLIAWLSYLMVEPYVRAHWPRTMVSWNRLLQGRWRDPMVGRDVLIGTAAGLLIALSFHVGLFDEHSPTALLGARFALSEVFLAAVGALKTTIAVYLVLLVLQSLFRRRWIAIAVFLTFIGSAAYVLFLAWESTVTAVIAGGLAVVMMLRLGVVAMVCLTFCATVAATMPLTMEFDQWYAPTGWIAALTIVTMAFVGGRLATTPERVLRGSGSFTRG